MAKDYGMKHTARHSRGVSSQLLLALVCFLLGYLSASIFDSTSLSNWINTQVLAQHAAGVDKKPIQQARLTPPKFEFYTLLASANHEASEISATGTANVANATKVANAASASEPIAKTDPTTALEPVVAMAKPTSKMAVVVPAQPVGAPGVVVKPIQALASASVPAKNGAYFVQVAAFKSNQEAQRMKATLALKGILASVTIIHQQHTNWYRVNLGPFASRDLAIKTQMTVARREHIVGMVRKMDA